MTKLFEIKDQIFKFCGEYETYLKYVYKFVIALALFCLINGTIGFMGRISSFPVSLLLALVCSILPQGMTILFAAVLVVLNLYVLSMEVAITALMIFVVIFFLYFRFAPKDGILVALTPICFALRIPFVLPIATGLLRNAYSVASVACGTIAYYFVDGVYQNVTALKATAAGGEATAKMTITAGQLLSNKEMYLVVGVFVFSAVAVNVIKKLAIDHSWKIAVGSGVLLQTAALIAGYLIFDIDGKYVGLIIGNIVAAVLGLVIEFLFMDLDYSRTERVQFEDDEYYYYVKAVPKRMVSGSSKSVTQFDGFSAFGKKKEKSTGEKITRKDIAQELDIDEELLK